MLAAAAHGAACADDIAFERGDVERAAGALFERNAGGQVAHDRRVSQQVLHDRPDLRIAVDQFRREPEAIRRSKMRALPLADRADSQQGNREKRCTPILLPAKVFDDKFRILRRRRHDVLQR